ncbi:MAG: lipopolysaccharide transport periplasmic protein LptA [Duodenibacillus sp.]
MIPRLLLSLTLASLALPFAAQAETADREKPLEVVAQKFNGDEIAQTAVYTGKVEVHQGTLEILGDRLEVVVSPEGWRTMTVTGNPVRMKERRDARVPGVEEWVHASALTAVYDEEKDLMTLLKVAKLARSENGLVKDSAAGDKIVYDLRTTRSRVEGDTGADGRKTRVQTVFAPRPKRAEEQKAAAPSKDASAPMQGASRLQ